jgi:4,5-dihydroxyphthalate decarboxylase
MDSVSLRLAVRDYDFVSPLATGDVLAEGVQLSLVRKFEALELLLENAEIDGGEASFSRYLHRIVEGDRSFVGLPVFLMREFRHRCIMVRQESDLTDALDLAGKRVGIDAWAASGNVWTRALLRERGVPIERVTWVVGPVNPGDRPGGVGALPQGVRAAPSGQSLTELLVAGELDALMSPWPPAEFYTAKSRIRRLYSDFRAAERAYYIRTKLYPAHHILVLRRRVVDRHPWVMRSLYVAFTQARQRSESNHMLLHEASPWVLADLEEQRSLMGPDFQAYGYRENQAIVAAFCSEQYAQGLITEPLNPDGLFDEFEQCMAEPRPLRSQ